MVEQLDFRQADIDDHDMSAAAKSTRKRKSSKGATPPSFDGRVLRGDDIIELRRFVYFCMGDDGRLSVWEYNFLNTLKQRLFDKTIPLTSKQLRVVEEIKAKLHFDQDTPPSPVDPDGIVENNDPDGYPLVPAEDWPEEDDAETWAASFPESVDPAPFPESIGHALASVVGRCRA